MKIYLPIAKVDAEKREVWGYASTEARDDQGEVVKREALVSALGDYMRFANIREMHQLSAVGVAREAAVDDRGLYVGARIVDDQAWQKVVEGVYKGYSIGGQITQRDPADYKTIIGLVLNEISLVDRPANPEAVFDYWKAAGALTMPDTRFNTPIQIWACGVAEHRHLAKADAVKCQERGMMLGEPVRADGTRESGSGVELIAAARNAIASAEGALEKAESKPARGTPYGGLEYADPGYQPDGRKRYPIDTERHIRAAWNFINRPHNARQYTAAQLDQIKARIVAAWKEKIDEDGPPSAGASSKAGRNPAQVALTKALWDVGQVARIILDLDWLEESLEDEAAMEGDYSPQPARLRAIIAELCGFLNALVVEETAEILDETEIGASDGLDVEDVLIMAAGTAGGALVADLCKARGPKLQKLAMALLAKSKHSHGDQALLDLAYGAVDKCIGMSGLPFAEKSHLTKARDALKAAGAASSEESTVDTAHNPTVLPPMVRPPAPEFRPGENSTNTTSRRPVAAGEGVLEMIAAALGKRGSGHQALMDVAHDCIGKLTGGTVCAAAKAGARHSEQTLERLAEAHDHLVAAGAKCDAAGFGPEMEWQGTEFDTGEMAAGKVAAGSLAKLLAAERAEKAALMATLTDIVPRLDQLSKRVEDIARTPLPPLTMGKSVTAIAKHQDSGAGAGGVSPDDLAAAFSRMSKEEQTLTLIKASYSNPIQPPGFASAKDLRGE